MQRGKRKNESLLHELITVAKKSNVEVRTERLLREVGYRAHSGYCRLNGQALIILDRDTPLGDQVDLLATELNKQDVQTTPSPPINEPLIK
ncbi:MAG: hypothetical protein ACE5HC_15220 [Candidatus Binatia bacterium]